MNNININNTPIPNTTNNTTYWKQRAKRIKIRKEQEIQLGVKKTT